jgi:hypothetical protein
MHKDRLSRFCQTCRAKENHGEQRAEPVHAPTSPDQAFFVFSARTRFVGTARQLSAAGWRVMPALAD